MLVEFGKANLLQKARQQPEKVRQVLDKIKSDGLMPTIDAVFKRADEPLPLGYCNAGVVAETGPGVLSELSVLGLMRIPVDSVDGREDEHACEVVNRSI